MKMKNSKKCKLILVMMFLISFFQITITFSQINVIISSNLTNLKDDIHLKSAATLNGPEAQYLIITHDDFKDAILPLAQSKVAKGFDTKIVTLTDIGSNAAQGIFEYIRNCYQSWNNLEYLLLVGDVEFIPHHSGSSAATDLYYGTMGSNTIGDDIHQDIFVGRLPAKTSTDVEIMVSKILHYESTYDPTLDWMNDVLCAADDEAGRDYRVTIEEIASYLEPNGHDITRVYTGGSYTGTTQDVLDAINQDVMLITHRNHGGRTGWVHPSFKISDIDDLDENKEYPTMFSVNCFTGQFDATSDCFGEGLLKARNKGAVAFIGATIASPTFRNNMFIKGLIDAIWPNFNPNYTNNFEAKNLGKVLVYGKQYAEEFMGKSKSYNEMYNLLGDPEFCFLDVNKPNTAIQSPFDQNMIPLIIGVTTAGTIGGLTLVTINKFHNRNDSKPKSKYKSSGKPSYSNNNNVRTYQNNEKILKDRRANALGVRNSSYQRTPLRSPESSRNAYPPPKQQHVRKSNPSLPTHAHRSPRQNYTSPSRRGYSSPATNRRLPTVSARNTRNLSSRSNISQYKGINDKRISNKKGSKRSRAKGNSS